MLPLLTLQAVLEEATCATPPLSSLLGYFGTEELGDNVIRSLESHKVDQQLYLVSRSSSGALHSDAASCRESIWYAI